MVRKRIRRAGAVIVATCTVFSQNPGEAHALVNTYCGYSVPPLTWCSDGSAHTYDRNKAYYNGSVWLKVCERLIYYSSRAEYGRSCEYMSTSQYYFANGSTMFEAQARHENASSRTIWGEGTA